MSVEPDEGNDKLVHVECIRCGVITLCVKDSAVAVERVCNECWHKQKAEESEQRGKKVHTKGRKVGRFR
jgi:hypothetical protein